MNWIFFVVAAAIIVKTLLQLTFQRLDRKSAREQMKVLPENLRGIVTPEAHKRSAEYTLEHNILGVRETLFGVVLKLILLSCGILPFLYNLTVESFGVGNFWAQASLMTLLGLFVGILFWPFEWISMFGIEAKYGFNRQTWKGWISDELKQWFLTIFLTVPLTTLVLWMSTNISKSWWFWAFLVGLIYEVVLTFLYPNFIEPLFNKFEPLQSGALKDRLESLAKRTNVSVTKILVMDASKRSAHANAYFAGIGSSRRIVLYDTLLKQLSDEEIEAVLAHEIGHMKHHHVLRGMYVGTAWQIVGFFLTNQLIYWKDFYYAFGFSPSNGVGGAFLILSMIGGAFAFWLTPVMAGWYRKNEYEADAFAAKAVGSALPLITGLKKMTKESLHSIEDHPLTHAFYASHPTLKEREEALLNPDSLIKKSCHAV